MSLSYLSLFDMAIAGVPALAFAIWQLISINREIKRDKMNKIDKDNMPPDLD